jgi:hypothetical protein
MLQPFARKAFTLITEFYSAVQKGFTFLFEKSAFLVSGPATFTVRHPDSFTFDIML